LCVYSWGIDDSTLALITWWANGETKGGAHDVIAIWDETKKKKTKTCVGKMIENLFLTKKGKWAPSCLGFDANRNPSKHRKGKTAQRASEQCGMSREVFFTSLWFLHWNEAKKHKKAFICSVSTLNQGSRKATLSAHWSAINDFLWRGCMIARWVNV
jgi:hypothetical protein